MWPQWANDHAHLQTKTVPMNLIRSNSARWLLSSIVHRIPRAIITLMGKPMWAWWANDHNGEYLQTKTTPMNLFWGETVRFLLSSGVHTIPGALITPMDTTIWAMFRRTDGRRKCHILGRIETMAFRSEIVLQCIIHGWGYIHCIPCFEYVSTYHPSI